MTQPFFFNLRYS